MVLTLDGTVLRELPLEGRGHDIALDRASGQAVVFARRPGSFALAFDIQDRREPVLFTTPANRHFYGHGVFSRDGRLLYATEHDNETRAGLIGVYDATGGYKRVGELPTYGIGPHEVILLADGKTLAVANGGIETHIETGREKLNLDSMQPSLAFIDSTTGRLISQHTQSAGLHKLSIRHLAQDARGAVWFGCQWEGADAETPELVGCAGLDQPLRIIEPSKPHGRFAGRLHRRGGDEPATGASWRLRRRVPAASSTSIPSVRVIVGETQLMDSCGVTGLAPSGFAMSSGMGVLQTDQPDHTHLRSASFPGRSFDNHLRIIG